MKQVQVGFAAILAWALMFCSLESTAEARDRLSHADKALRQGRPAEAQAVLHAFIGENSQDPEAHYLLGNAYEAQGNSAAARKSYETYVNLRRGDLPANPEVLIRLRRHGLY